MPRVSVIIPNYNHGRYLAQRLDSVLKQSFQDFEVIFLDDCSTDNSLMVLEPYSRDPRIQVILNQQNSGSPFRQWNKGLEVAKGEFIWIAESDDYAELNMLDALVSALIANPAAGLAYCQSWVVSSEDGGGSRTLLETPYASFADGNRWKRDFVNSGVDELATYLVYKNTIPNASAVLFRKSQLHDGIRPPENMRLAGDWMFWSTILANSDVVYVSTPLNYFREPHSGSQRDKTKKSGLDLIEGLEIYSFVEHKGLLNAVTKREVLRYQVKLWGSLACLRGLSWSTNRDIYHKILDVHPEVRSNSTKAVLIPFMFFYFSAPIRRLPRVVSAYKSLVRGVRTIFKANRAP